MVLALCLLLKLLPRLRYKEDAVFDFLFKKSELTMLQEAERSLIVELADYQDSVDDYQAAVTATEAKLRRVQQKIAVCSAKKGAEIESESVGRG